MDNVLLTTNRDIEKCICPRCCSMQTFLGDVNLLAKSKDCSTEWNLVGYGLICNKCRHSFITEYETIKAMETMTQSDRGIASLSFKNATASYDSREDGYLFRAKGGVNNKIYEPWDGVLHYYGILEQEAPELSDEEKLYEVRSTSILRVMGYSINLDEVRRHRILKTASRLFGKSIVNRILTFSISSRMRNGEVNLKYSYAVSVWQSDKEYLKTLVCNQKGFPVPSKHSKR